MPKHNIDWSRTNAQNPLTLTKMALIKSHWNQFKGFACVQMLRLPRESDVGMAIQSGLLKISHVLWSAAT
jgi:hypothetical protein